MNRSHTGEKVNLSDITNKHENSENLQGYFRSSREQVQLGATKGVRQEITLEEARSEFVEALSRVASKVFWGTPISFVTEVTQPSLIETLIRFEERLEGLRRDTTIVSQEIVDRLVKSKRDSVNQKKRPHIKGSRIR